MPLSVLGVVPEAHSLDLDGIAAVLNATCAPGAAAPVARLSRRREHPEVAIAIGRPREPEEASGPAAGLVCPDCSGALFTVDDPDLLRFRCRVGHAWTAEALIRAQGRALEETLWAAIRVLEEEREVQERMESRARSAGRTRAAARAAAARSHRETVIRSLRDVIDVLGSDIVPDDGPDIADDVAGKSNR
jgi:two-component system chemotaxis response regulator CheB